MGRCVLSRWSQYLSGSNEALSLCVVDHVVRNSAKQQKRRHCRRLLGQLNYRVTQTTMPLAAERAQSASYCGVGARSPVLDAAAGLHNLQLGHDVGNGALDHLVQVHHRGAANELQRSQPKRRTRDAVAVLCCEENDFISTKLELHALLQSVQFVPLGASRARLAFFPFRVMPPAHHLLFRGPR